MKPLDAIPAAPLSGAYKYPWPEWFQNSRFLLERGTDYDIATTGMKMNAHRYAKSQGLNIRTVTTPEGLAIEVLHRHDVDQAEAA